MNIRPVSEENPVVQLRSIAACSTSIEQEWYSGGACQHGHDDAAADPFIPIVLRFVRNLVQFVDQADFRVRDQFQKSMWALGQLGVSEQQLAPLLSTTPNAVNRWMNGRSAPTPVVRELVVRAALDILRRDGMKIAGQRYDAISGRPNIVASGNATPLPS